MDTEAELACSQRTRNESETDGGGVVGLLVVEAIVGGGCATTALVNWFAA